MAKLTEDISEVHSIMTKNIQDVLNHGERLDSKLNKCFVYWQSAHLQVSAPMSDVNLGDHMEHVITKILSVVTMATAFIA